MRVIFFFGRGRAGIRLIGLVGLVGMSALVLMLVILDHLRPEIGPEQAEKRIRSYYRAQIAGRHLHELQAHRLRFPDVDMARRWQADLSRVRLLVFSSTRVKRPWIDLLSDLPNHLARTRIRDAMGREQVRCFWISAYRFDRELPAWVWYLLF